VRFSEFARRSERALQFGTRGGIAPDMGQDELNERTVPRLAARHNECR